MRLGAHNSGGDCRFGRDFMTRVEAMEPLSKATDHPQPASPGRLTGLPKRAAPSQEKLQGDMFGPFSFRELHKSPQDSLKRA